MATETNRNDISQPPEAGPSRTTKSKLPTSLKVAVGLVITHGILVFLDAALGGATAYWLGRASGPLIMSAVIAWVLLRVKKFGWSVSVFLVCAEIFSDVSNYRRATQGVTDPELLGAIFFGNALFIVLLLGALVALVMPRSRKPFKQLRLAQRDHVDEQTIDTTVSSETKYMEARSASVRGKVSLLLGVFLVVLVALYVLNIFFMPHEEVEEAGLRVTLVALFMGLSPFAALFGIYLGWTSLNKGGDRYLAWSGISLNVIICIVFFIFFVYAYVSS